MTGELDFAPLGTTISAASMALTRSNVPFEALNGTQVNERFPGFCLSPSIHAMVVKNAAKKIKSRAAGEAFVVEAKKREKKFVPVAVAFQDLSYFRRSLLRISPTSAPAHPTRWTTAYDAGLPFQHRLPPGSG
ncbi:hypothetical protein DVH05_007746 [Phytophthora capsici]|nr:hypothetical protein DVH05_007746 [Phytophthora capsici]